MDKHNKRPTRSTGGRHRDDRAAGISEGAPVTFGSPVPNDARFDSLLARIDETDRQWREAAQAEASYDPDTDL